MINLKNKRKKHNKNKRINKQMATSDTIKTEESCFAPFFNKTPVSIERGDGVFVWDEEGKKYIDFTSGWGVTCIGHAHPIITEALCNQSKKIIQNPNSGLTYSPVRASLLSLMIRILPPNLTRVFFSNSGAEANDAAIKLARKATGRTDVISTNMSFHGRTISTASATGQAKHRDKFKPLMPGYRFVPFNDAGALKSTMDENTAAVILEPIQGEGGVCIPSEGYLEEVSRLCKSNGSLLIVDEIQTGFWRTGSVFAISDLDVKADFLTMAKGIAGGFPFGAFAMSNIVAENIEKGDHGGTYCGNPLGCAVSIAVLGYLIDHDIASNVKTVGGFALNQLNLFKQEFSEIITDVRGKGLLLAIEFKNDEIAKKMFDLGFEKGLLLNITQGKVIRIFPALNITRDEMEEGLVIIKEIMSLL